DHDELCWLRSARVAPDDVHVVGAFVESLSWRQGDLLAAPDPFDDRPFEHIDEGVRIVPMDVLHSSSRILDGENQHLPSSHLSEIGLHDGGHNWLRRSLREGGTEGQGGDNERTEAAFHRALLRLGNLYQAATCERRSHSSKRMEPRRG